VGELLRRLLQKSSEKEVPVMLLAKPLAKITEILGLIFISKPFMNVRFPFDSDSMQKKRLTQFTVIHEKLNLD